MANRRPQTGGSGGRRMDFGRNNDRKNFGRGGVSPWQGGGPSAGLPNLLPLAGGSTEATLALASNIINLLQPRQNPVPSLLDMPIRRDFVPNMGRFDRSYGPNRMGNQGNFRRTGNYNRAGERINSYRKQFRPNDGQKQQNKSSPRKDADSKAKPVKESDEAKKDEADDSKDTKEDRKEVPKTHYDDINPQLLKCHICNKSMWDGRSFENHLSGRAHAIMMQKTAESYALTADTMRQEFKIREMKRTRKSGQQPTRDFYCAMCDMYAADGAAHRTTVGHRKLKKYLHPTCTSCHKEMPTRIELDEHRLTAEHLKNMQDKQEVVLKPKPEVMVISTLSMEQCYLRDDRQRRRRDDRHHKNDHKEDHKDDQKDDKEDNKDNKEDDENAEEKKEGENDQEDVDVKKDEKCPTDTDDTILDYKEGDDLSHVTQEMLPVYSTKRGVGSSFLSEFRCFQCRLCHKLLDSEETAQVHLRTWKHHQLFIRSIQPQQVQEPAKRPLPTDEDGTEWKRRKVNDADNEDNDEEHNGIHGNDDVVKTEENKEEDGDVEMPAADELEDWEQTVDDILHDEKSNDQDKEEVEQEPAEIKQEVEQGIKEEVTEEMKQEEEVKPASPISAVPDVEDKPRASPRTRGRGRGRGRGRY